VRLSECHDKEATVQNTFDITNIPLELDRREGDGIVVSLLWRKDGNVVSVAVTDDRSGEDFELVVPPDRALDAFHHPYAYAAGRGLLGAPAHREPIYA
jgi:hypothetical protein